MGLLDSALGDCYRFLDHNSAAPEGFTTLAGEKSPRWHKLLDFSGATVDRTALKALEALFLSKDQPDMSGDLRRRIQEAYEVYSTSDLLQHPERFYYRAKEPNDVCVETLSRLYSGLRSRLTFTSTYQTWDQRYQHKYAAYKKNRINRIHFWHHFGSPRPLVICIHPWCGGMLPLEERIFGAKALYNLGLDVVFFTMPFHGSRRPKEALFSGQLFPNRNLRRTNEAFGQAISDLRALIFWLRHTLGTRIIGLMGISLGGYLTALMAGIDKTLAFALPIAAPCSFADVLWNHGTKSPGRRIPEEAGFTLDDFRCLWAIHCPLSYPLQIPKQNVMITWFEGDVIVPRNHQYALWEHWGRPAIQQYSGGHLLQTGWSSYRRSILGWIQSKLSLTQ